MKNSQIQQLFFHVICDRKLPVTLLNGTRFLQLFLSGSQFKEKLSYEMSASTGLEANLYFHVMIVKSRENIRKKVIINLDGWNSMLDDMEVLLVQKAWDALTKPCLSGPIRPIVEPYMWFKLSLVQFQVPM